jgi:uncharacterized protein YjeT (DUF2065 family)
MSTLELLSMVLVILGVIVFLASFTNVEMITGLWVAGDIERDKQFIEAGQFKKRVYWILRLAGMALFVIGLVLMQLLK